jgi:hypothetical protein
MAGNSAAGRKWCPAPEKVGRPAQATFERHKPVRTKPGDGPCAPPLAIEILDVLARVV